MTARTATIGIVVLFLLALGGALAVVLVNGARPPVLTGFLLGGGIGCLTLLVETFLLSWALGRRMATIQAVLLAGFGLRILIVSIAIIAFASGKTVDPVAFALTYVASFFAFIGFVTWIVLRGASRRVAARG